MSWDSDLTYERGGDLFDGSLAVFDARRFYRYVLTRGWGSGPLIVFLMLNPSTADAHILDPTITRCVAFAKREGGGRLAVVNLFALRSTNPAGLRDHPDPVGPANDAAIRETCQGAPLVVAGWGATKVDRGRAGALSARAGHVAGLLAAAGVSLHCLGVTKHGHPLHPLYLKGDTPLVPWPGYPTETKVAPAPV